MVTSALSLVTDEDLCELFGFKTTSYLQKTCKLNCVAFKNRGCESRAKNKVTTRNINHRYVNFLFELLTLKMSLICSYLLPIFSLVTPEKFVLKVYDRINKIF